ncbi:OLC1v1016439C1 [Oldenlandia corymbosa var. corymbosa]|uniref:OLC1v1016439C1 n=1 Tax=Oldenlandia corymbosa var. corymbosa TaxID=529605 RepID=A0AAV1E5S1_OLDCO|nr:OLC1v1016439C1 [Oldenlandia corymbosa var. corymbosa]
MFTNEDVSGFMGVTRVEPNIIEIECRLTLRRYGDSYGKLRISTDGKLEIDCCCFSNCPKVNLSPVEFARHMGKNTNIDNWKNHLWVMDAEGNRISLGKTNLLRYHIQTFERPLRRPYVHRDEFIRCSKCNKERRFSRRTKELCRIYHDAFLKQDWQCSDMPPNKITCDEAEERKSRKKYRGCYGKSNCNGCIKCVCIGCNMCSKSDNRLQIKIDLENSHGEAEEPIKLLFLRRDSHQGNLFTSYSCYSGRTRDCYQAESHILGVGAIGGRNHSTVAAEFSSGVRPWTRPLSPHLPVYKPQSNSTSSIFNRIAGVYLTAVVLAPYFLRMKVGTVAFTYDYIYQLFFYSSKLTPISVKIAALALGYHVYKGIGHLVADASGKVEKVAKPPGEPHLLLEK